MKISNSRLKALLNRGHDGNPVGPLARISAEKMNVQAALKVRKTMRALEGPYKDFASVQDSLVSEYGTDGALDPKHPRWKEFIGPYTELLNTEVDIDVPSIDVKDLWSRGEDGERVPIDLSPDELGLLGEILTFEEE